MKSFGWYEFEDSLYIAMEYIPSGDLHQSIMHLPAVSNLDAATITTQLLEGLYFMHDNDFAHRDMKPQVCFISVDDLIHVSDESKNVLVMSRPPDHWWVKIADFGISKRLEEEHDTTTAIQGSLRYMAPEIVLRGHSQDSRSKISRDHYKADVWAVGCILYFVLTKMPAFPTLAAIFSYYQGCSQCPAWTISVDTICESGRDLMRALLECDFTHRLTAEEALVHPWIQKHQLDATSQQNLCIEYV